MAIFALRIDTLGCKGAHIGLVLFGRFLEQGFLDITMTMSEQDALWAALGNREPLALIQAFTATAHKLGFETEVGRWQYESAKSGRRTLIWDPQRISRTNIA